LRFDRLNVDFTNRRTNQQLARRDNLFSPRAGLVLKPVEAMSFYGSYAVSYLPGSGDQFGALTATSQTLEPEQFMNRELGFKWDARRNLAVTAAVYRLDRTNTTAPDPVTPGVIVQTGAQRTSGFEFGVNGAPTEHWQVAGGYANQRARILSRTSAAAAGATPALVPKQTLSLWNRYQIVRRVAAGVGVVHQSEVFTSFDNLVQLPAFTRVDAAAFLTLTRTIQAQVNIENLTNRRYFPTAHNNNNIMPGSPRMLRVSLSVGQ
jgi:catecholate siderophore receptor